MPSLSFILGVIGNIISLLVFLSPVGTFKRVVKVKSTENFKGLPYVCTLLSTSLWTFYGILKPDGLLVYTVNGAGAVLQAIYVTLFLIFAPKDTKVKYLMLVAILNIGCVGLVIGIAILALHGSVRLTVVGFICAGLTLGMYGSPLISMRTVIKTKSVEYMPFFLSFFLFLNAGVWSAYSVVVKDFFIGVPNAMGFVLGSAQLILYAIYRNKSDPLKLAEKMEEEGSAHLVQKSLEMGKLEERTIIKERSLSKGKSLPKTAAVFRQLSIQKIMKAHSLDPDELQPSLLVEEDIENRHSNVY